MNIPLVFNFSVNLLKKLKLGYYTLYRILFSKVYKKHMIYLGLGSNIGDRKINLERAIKFLNEKIENIDIAKFYETDAWGYLDQPRFINTALKGNTELSPTELLNFVKKIEEKIGRKKTFRWGPREIDIDILFYDDIVWQDENLTIPHPFLHERDFVLKPLMDIAPELIHPIFKKTIREILISKN